MEAPVQKLGDTHRLRRRLPGSRAAARPRCPWRRRRRFRLITAVWVTDISSALQFYFRMRMSAGGHTAARPRCPRRSWRRLRLLLAGIVMNQSNRFVVVFVM